MNSLKAFIKPFDAPQTNQLTGLYMRASLAFNGLSDDSERKGIYRAVGSEVRHLIMRL